jgi:hypothetical protein
MGRSSRLVLDSIAGGEKSSRFIQEDSTVLRIVTVQTGRRGATVRLVGKAGKHVAKDCAIFTVRGVTRK